MPLSIANVKRAKLNDILVILAIIGVFGAFAIIGNRDAAYFWPKLFSVVAFSTVCLVLTRDRTAVDAFFAAIAALFTLVAMAMTAGDRQHPNWWPLFIGFFCGAIGLVFLTRKKRETVFAIALIVGFRLIIYAFSRLFLISQASW